MQIKIASFYVCIMTNNTLKVGVKYRLFTRKKNCWRVHS